MLIFDSILQRKHIHEMTEVLGGRIIDHIADDITNAHKFVLDRSLAEAADSVSWQEVERIMSQCRLPFQNVWIECLHRDRPNFWSAAMGESKTVFEVKKPKRIGVLFCGSTREDRLSFTMTLFWSFNNDDVQNSAICMAMNYGEDAKDVLSFRKLMHMPTERLPDGTILPELEKRVSPLPCPYWIDFMQKMLPLDKQNRLVPQLVTAAVNDWGHEPIYWSAVLALLNCRNVATTTTVDVSGINRARRKRGQPLFAEHKVLKLRLPGAIRNCVAGSADSERAQMRGHFVRGHFKQRKSGLFWWSDFLRGDSARMVNKVYHVEMSEGQ